MSSKGQASPWAMPATLRSQMRRREDEDNVDNGADTKSKIVPFGMALLGSFRSPDMFAPAMMPVTAGENTARATAKLTLPSAVSSTSAAVIWAVGVGPFGVGTSHRSVVPFKVVTTCLRFQSGMKFWPMMSVEGHHYRQEVRDGE